MRIYPHYRFQDVTKIPLQLFAGKKLLLFDIDNTLFYSETIEIRGDILKWFRYIQKTHHCLCFSNSFSIRKRKPRIEKLLGCEVYLSKYKKPSQVLFYEICRAYKVTGKDMVVIGDFHFTDILFANRNNATSILVHPLGKEGRVSLVFARLLETIVLFLLQFFVRDPALPQ